MKLLIITHVQHKPQGSQIYAYGPYVKEMNLWFKYPDEVRVIGPLTQQKIELIDLAYVHRQLNFVAVPAFNLLSLRDVVKTVFKLPLLWGQIIKGMIWADHIHLRCPGNMGLLGSIAQIFFPHKSKTAKYAGNWDPASQQPWSYKLQKWLLSNTVLTKNMKVLVYGEWLGQSENIMPFFTASYHEAEKEDYQPNTSLPRSMPRNAERSPMHSHAERGNEETGMIYFLYVGALSAGKRPMLSVQAVHKLVKEEVSVHLDVFGEGSERSELEAYIREHQLENHMTLHGNQNAEIIKASYRQAHFLIFMSKSEGWPKVVAEAMFWGCLPITSDVSCVHYMLGYGERGKVVAPEVKYITKAIHHYVDNRDEYQQTAHNAMQWSRQFTLEKFAAEIGRLLGER